MIKNKIAVVNIFFPPNTRGGATRIVADECSILNESYGNEFELVVFTANTNSTNYYSLNVYPYNGFRVYQATVALTESTNRREKDEKIGELFDKFLEFEQPDLVHFHCIQALTASIVEVTKNRSIPHLVTIHDAWWISDHQFLIDKYGKVYPDGHPNLLDEVNLPDDTTLEESFMRRAYLKRLLNESNGVLAVSERFRHIYEINGIQNVITNKNGISNEVSWLPKNTMHIERVVCAHIGGMSLHKGFDIFKQAVINLDAPNIEVLIVDHSKDENYSSITYWGSTIVNIIGHVYQEHIGSLYGRIDVLFAPSTCPESFGLVTREAAACGCWVVGSDIGAIGEDITVENGFRITPTAENLLEVLKKIDKNSKKYKGISKSQYVRYSSEQVDELIDIFKKTIKPKKDAD